MDIEAAKQIFNAGEHLEREGKIEQAIACYQQATKLHPERSLYHYKLGMILRQQDRLEEAIECFHRAIAINSNDSWSYHALGEIAVKQQDLDTAATYFQQAIKLNPEFSWSHYNLARALQQQKQLQAALIHYQLAIKLDSEFFWSHYFLAEILTKFNDNQAAIYHYQEVIRLKPQFFEAYYQLARHLQNEGELERAAEYYYRGIELNKENYNCYYYLGETLIQLQRFTEAIKCYESAIALQPNNLQSYFYLGKALISKDQNALANYRSLAREKSPVFQVNFELGLAQAWQQLGKYSNSIKCCQRAIEIEPTAELPFRILQYIPIDKKEIDRVITFYQQIANRDRVCPLLWGNLGDLLSKQSRIPEAIDCYRTSCYENTIIKNPQLAELDWEYNKQKAPDFLIIGATKCGTTSLFTYLDRHPQILSPHKKEINFFNHHFEMGVPWYLAHFPAIADLPEFITGEASPFYIYDERVINRIKQLFPNIKLIAMLRNPVERTISEYYHAANHGIENRSLEKIIELEKKRLSINSRSEAMQNFGYLLNSIYVEKIAKWINNFPQENILIIKSESFFEDTGLIMERVCQFLGVSYQSLDRHIRYNVGTYPPVARETKQKLQEFFIPYNQELEEYLDRQFNWQ